MMAKPWSGRFTQSTNELFEEFTASIHFDKRLYKYDIQGSIAHSKMLAKCGIIKEEEAQQIIGGLSEILKEIEVGSFQFSPHLEDIHMNIEGALMEKIGPTGGRLHTARSRNDQIALDIRLYLRDEINAICKEIDLFEMALVQKAKENSGAIMPGYTHMQRAQAVLLAHHLLAYYEMLERDNARLKDCLKRVNVMPLGSAALAGTSFPIDRHYVAQLLDFPEISQNSMDAVSDRDFAIEFAACAAILMMHLSRLCEEMVLWCMSEFGFVELADAFSSGSSIMPQKKNPDAPELVRAKTGKVYGSLMALLTVMKALPLSYNRDLQEDKIPIFNCADTVKSSLRIICELFKEVKFNRQRMKQATSEGFLVATEMADYLVTKGLPFRLAHEVVGKVVSHCIGKGKNLDELTLDELMSFSKLFGQDVFDKLSIQATVASKTSPGGTAPELVKRRIKEIVAEKKWGNV